MVTRSNGVRGWRRKKTGSYRCTLTRGTLGAKRSSSICMGAMVEAPLACLHYESRGSLSDVLCDAIRIVLYAKNGPFVWRKASRKFSGGHRTTSIKRRSSIHFRFARYFVRIATCYSSICAVFCCYDDDNEGEHCYRDRREFCFDIEEGRFRLLLD